MKRIAPEGYVWVCIACGKYSIGDRYGENCEVSIGWDESCILNSCLVKEGNYTENNGRVIHVSITEDEEGICVE